MCSLGYEDLSVGDAKKQRHIFHLQTFNELKKRSKLIKKVQIVEF